jgi:dihydrofolate reductase
VPIFVLTHHPPTRKPKSGAGQSFTFVSDGIESAIDQAKQAAGGKDVAVIPGTSTTNQCLLSGMVDELHVEIMPVILGGGLRPFQAPGLEKIKLKRIKLMEFDNGGVHIRYQIEK